MPLATHSSTSRWPLFTIMDRDAGGYIIRAASDVEPRQDNVCQFYVKRFDRMCSFYAPRPLTSYSKTIGRGGGFYFLGDRVVSSTFIRTLIILCSICYLKVSRWHDQVIS